MAFGGDEIGDLVAGGENIAESGAGVSFGGDNGGETEVFENFLGDDGTREDAFPAEKFVTVVVEAEVCRLCFGRFLSFRDARLNGGKCLLRYYQQ
ncbi:hypothetical protein IKF74_00725 [Candidatus Saccharibacteria bacterium]|nr:hypothetical protein [Candidatus Saccharibacteria bacterium]